LENKVFRRKRLFGIERFGFICERLKKMIEFTKTTSIGDNFRDGIFMNLVNDYTKGYHNKNDNGIFRVLNESKNGLLHLFLIFNISGLLYKVIKCFDFVFIGRVGGLK
jgi:hypothetical protein